MFRKFILCLLGTLSSGHLLTACTSPQIPQNSLRRLPNSESTTLVLTPIRKNASGGLGFTVPVTFVSSDGRRVTKSLLVDTGSSGVHILKSELQGINLDHQGPSVLKTYGGGGKLFGHVYTLGLQFGEQGKPTSIEVDV